MPSTSTDRRIGVYASQAIKVPCKAATTANITLSGEQTIDGVSCTTGDRVLVRSQTTSSENGIYEVDTSTWQRAKDWDGSRDIVKGTLVRVTDGTLYSDSYWAVTTSNPITIGTTGVTIAQVNASLSGVSAFIQTLIDDADAASARQTLLLDVKGSDVASASTINLTTSTGDLVDVTGTTTITAVTLAEGMEKTVRFTGSLLLTHGSSLILPDSANIQTAAGDFAVFRGFASSVVRCVSYHRLQRHGSDVASAATVNLDTATGDLIDVTGTTTITAITLAEGRERTVRFTGALTLTHGASLVLPGAANITTAAGDFATFRGYGSSVVRCVSYTRAAVEPLAIATQAQIETGTATNVVVTPGRQHYHNSACKAWVRWTTGGAIDAGYNVSSITDSGTGDWSINFTNAFSSGAYSGCLTPIVSGATMHDYKFDSMSASAADVLFSAETNVTAILAAFFGDQ